MAFDKILGGAVLQIVAQQLDNDFFAVREFVLGGIKQIGINLLL